MNTSQDNNTGIGVSQRHQAALDQGRFLIQHCKNCGGHIYFPRESCPLCGSAEVELISPDGRGTVYAVTTVRRKDEAGGDINVSLIDLDEGVRLMSRVDGLPLDVIGIGQRVRARVELVGDRGRIVFDAVDAGGSV
jgi:uncharacterized OB-fold protein